VMLCRIRTVMLWRINCDAVQNKDCDAVQDKDCDAGQDKDCDAVQDKDCDAVQRSAQYVSANCVIFTYYSGDISKADISSLFIFFREIFKRNTLNFICFNAW
jgi:hypothetical protein